MNMLHKIVLTIQTQIVARTKHQKRRLRLLERSLDRVKLEARVKIDDLDRVVEHIVRVNNMIQECIWYRGFQLEKDDTFKMRN